MGQIGEQSDTPMPTECTWNTGGHRVDMESLDAIGCSWRNGSPLEDTRAHRVRIESLEESGVHLETWAPTESTGRKEVRNGTIGDTGQQNAFGVTR